MFTAYIDDSGTAPSQRVAIGTALLIPGRRILALDKEWDTLKREEGFPSFHTSEFAARNPKKGFDWDDDKHSRVFRRVREITKKYGVKAFSFAVNKSDYDQVVPPEFRKHSGQCHYSWAIRHVLAFLVDWRVANGVSEPLQFVFDWMGERRKNPRRREVETVIEQAEVVAIERGIRGEYSNWGFGHHEDVTGLQCVDAIAWTCYQYALFVMHKQPLHPDADTAWDDFYYHRNRTWLQAVTVTRENLTKWVQAEIASGKAMKRFQEWEAQKRPVAARK